MCLARSRTAAGTVPVAASGDRWSSLSPPAAETGPWVVMADEAGDPQDLALRLRVNGQLRQDGSTRNMIFGVDHPVWYLQRQPSLAA